MAEENNIENKIKESFESFESFENLNSKAPEGMWDKINQNLSEADMLDPKIKDSFENVTTKAPEQVWEGVKKQLNIDRSWKRVKQMLDRRTYLRRTRRLAVLLVLLLLINWGGYELYFDDQANIKTNAHKTTLITENVKSVDPLPNEEVLNSKEMESNSPAVSTSNSKAAVQSISNKKENKNQNINNSSFKDKGTRSNQGEVLTVEMDNDDFTQEISHPSIEKVEGENVLHHKNLLVKEMSLLPFVLHSNTDSSALLSFKDPEHQEETLYPVKDRKFDLGLIYAYNNTWLINNETKSSFEETSLISSEITYGGSYGLTGNYSLSNKSAISGTFYINSKTKQNYTTYLEGRYTYKSIELDYGKLIVSYKRYIRPNPITPGNFYFSTGVYGAYLKNEKIISNGRQAASPQVYVASDYGVVLRAGQDIRNGRFLFGYGLNLEKGLKNIFSGNGKIPADFNHTSSLNAGAFINFRYKF